MKLKFACVVSIVSSLLAYASPTMAQNVAPLPKGTGVYSSCMLSGAQVADLYTYWVGYHGRLPEHMIINFNDQLTQAWEQKFQISAFNKDVVKLGMKVLLRYDVHKATHIKLDQYVHRATLESGKVYTKLLWDKLGKDYFRRNSDVDRRLALLQAIAGQINGRDLIAYSMTEIMPSHDGDLNKSFLECLLRNAGKEFVESVPSLGDKIASFGPFQFTPHAIFDDGKLQIGASRVNLALPEELRIPANLEDLRGDQHLRAGYMFAINNLAYMIALLSPTQVARLERYADLFPEDVLVFVAIAHHSPSEAVTTMKRWLDSRAAFHFADYLSRYREYADKTMSNRNALNS